LGTGKDDHARITVGRKLAIIEKVGIVGEKDEVLTLSIGEDVLIGVPEKADFTDVSRAPAGFAKHVSKRRVHALVHEEPGALLVLTEE